MPKAAKKSSSEQSVPPLEVSENTDTQAESSNSDQELDPEVSFHPAVHPLTTPTMFMLYIEGHKMNWTVGDGLYHRFLKWRLKCETILDSELANLPAKQKCQKVIAWSGDFGMDLYASWSIPKEELTLDTIWAKFEEFSKPQMNEIMAYFDLLTSFHQGNRNVNVWYNAVQAQVNLAKYPPETAKILHRDIFWFFMKDEDFVTKTINEGNVNIQKFPASKVRQLAKKMETSKATAKHIRQVAGDLPVAQIQLMQHQHTELPAGNYPKRKKTTTARQKLQYHRILEIHTSQKPFDLWKSETHPDRCTRRGDILYTKGFQCPARKFQCKACHKFGHFTTICYQKIQQPSGSFKTRKPKAQQL